MRRRLYCNNTAQLSSYCFARLHGSHDDCVAIHSACHLAACLTTGLCRGTSTGPFEGSMGHGSMGHRKSNCAQQTRASAPQRSKRSFGPGQWRASPASLSSRQRLWAPHACMRARLHRSSKVRTHVADWARASAHRQHDEVGLQWRRTTRGKR